jgi:DNA-binding HxlR family transcriptional regulator
MKNTKLCQQESCPVFRAIQLVGDIWVIMIIKELLDGGKKYTELSTKIPAICTATLATRLKKLEKEEIVTKTEFIEYPYRVEYNLTEKGFGLAKIIKEIKQYSEKYL